MMRKSKVVTLLVVCVMMFAAVEPALAWGNRTGSQTGDAVAYGAGAGTVAAGVAAGALIFLTGGLATPFVIGAAAVAGAAGAAGGAYYGYNVEEKSLLKDAAVIAGAGAGGGAVAAAAPVVAPMVAGAVSSLTGSLTAAEVGGAAGGAAVAGGSAVVESLKQSAVQTVNNNKDTITSSIASTAKDVATKAWNGVGAFGTIYGAYEGAKELYGWMKSGSDETGECAKKLDEKLQKLGKAGKKVVLNKVEFLTPNSLTAHYTADGVEHVETFYGK